MKNTGLVVANDLKPERQKATIGNLHRLGVHNAIVVTNDGRKLPKVRTRPMLIAGKLSVVSA